MITFEDVHDIDGRAVRVGFTEDYELDQLKVMIEALHIYSDRNQLYQDNWRRQGWRSPLFDLRRKVERVWDVFWDKAPRTDDDPEFDVDDALDALNFAAILVRAIRENNRDGYWWAPNVMEEMARRIGREVAEHAKAFGLYGKPPPDQTKIGSPYPPLPRPTPYDLMEARRGEPMTDALIQELNSELQSYGYRGIIEIGDNSRELHYKED